MSLRQRILAIVVFVKQCNCTAVQCSAGSRLSSLIKQS